MAAWRKLTASERQALAASGSSASDWNDIQVTDGFDPSLVSRCSFSGSCRIALTAPGTRECGGLRLPVGISNSRIDSCTIADGCAVHDVRFLRGYDIGEGCLLFNIGQMTADGSFRGPVIEVMNENGARKVHAFPGMTCTDAWLMAKYPDDGEMQRRLRGFSADLPMRPSVGAGSVIANVPYIDRLQCGPACRISSAVRLESLCLCSTREEPVTVDGNAVLSDGVVGAGSRVTGGCIAAGFALGACCTLSGGVRFFNSVLGDNSTVSCGELVSDLIFPAHEQHHNNSFLIAACTGGQSNIAAGATIGSNHNGRTADGELVAGRGFWPGLCVSLKHSSVFASYTMIAKGSYPAELDIRLPFSLVSDNEHEGRLEIIPAFAWLYNMYALVRNGMKYRSRDRRKQKVQHIEFDAFAPDSMQEVARARRLLEDWAREYCGWMPGEPFPREMVLPGGCVEKSRRPVAILKADRAREAYREMLVHYAAGSLSGCSPEECRDLSGGISAGAGPWINCGGQMVREQDVTALRSDIRSGKLGSWEEVHGRFDELWAAYPEQKRLHAAALLNGMNGWTPDGDGIGSLLAEGRRLLAMMAARAEQSRAKDFGNPFRAATCRDAAELEAVFGRLQDDKVIGELRSRIPGREAPDKP